MNLMSLLYIFCDIGKGNHQHSKSVSQTYTPVCPVCCPHQGSHAVLVHHVHILQQTNVKCGWEVAESSLRWWAEVAQHVLPVNLNQQGKELKFVTLTLLRISSPVPWQSGRPRWTCVRTGPPGGRSCSPRHRSRTGRRRISWAAPPWIDGLV